MKTPQQRKNLEDALIWWPTVPEKNVCMVPCYLHEDHQELVKDFCELAVSMPNIAAQGFILDKYQNPYMAKDPKVCGRKVSKIIYGNDFMFSYRGGHPADQGFIGSDHALVMRRIEWELEHDCE